MDARTVIWRKSSYSSNDGADCVEVARHGDRIAARDSKQPDGPQLRFGTVEWQTFMTGVKTGRFDLSQ
ncbi:MAG TPA: DUF397 domain-containing protein [Streptosporangiaceae bacterium]|nr:DUF397 domain-containing protein [Streptosporangiaceae bacterium]